MDEDCDGDVNEADADIDSCEPPSWDGTYSGSFSLAVSVPSLGLGDTCAGTGVVEVDAAVSPAVLGSVSCTFTGALATFLPGAQTVSFDGEFSSANTATGTVGLAGVLTDDWEGTFSSPDRFVAVIDGTGSYSGFTIDYSGELDASR